MFKKRIASGSAETNRPREDFPKGLQFIRDGRIWRVVEEIEDTTAVWRRLMADTGEEELVTLSTLKKDLGAKTVQFIDIKKK